MVYFQCERIPTISHGKLSRRKYGPYRILKALGYNAYLVELLDNIQASLIFNVSKIFQYHDKPPTTGDTLVLPLADAS